MEPTLIILIVAIVAGYFIFYRPMFILQPAKKREQLIAKYETVTNLNQQLITDLQQYAQQNNALDKDFMEGNTFRQKIAELQAAREKIFNEETYTGLRALNSKNLDMDLMSKTLDDQAIYHQRIQKALSQYKTASGAS